MAKDKEPKTNAMRIIESAGIAFETHSYESDGKALDGVTVAAKLGKSPDEIYKTLVTKGSGRDPYVFVVPAGAELDLKKAAKAVGEKAVAMIPVADINKLTGYVRGGCSPVGMKKQYTTVIHATARALPTITVSAGRIGRQVELNANDLAALIGARFEEITR